MSTQIQASSQQSSRRSLKPRWQATCAAIMVGLTAGLAALPARSAVDISPTPLFLPQGVPGNLLFTPSVEWPTINVAAYKEMFVTAGIKYTGLFDAGYCYVYTNDSVRGYYFDPVSNADASGACAGDKEWSGKFMNWATTQAIEPFRIALTGGNRVRDDAQTWIQKARQDGQGDTAQFPNWDVTNAAIISGYTPAAWNQHFKTRIQGLGSRMRFTSTGDVNATPVAYDPEGVAGPAHELGNANADRSTVYDVIVRVRVCKPGFLSTNCVGYGSNHKPEGLIQEYSKQLRYGVFGYLNDHGFSRDGAALRARQKFVGPQEYPPLEDPVTNAFYEWDANGIIRKNPNPVDALTTGAEYSGVINYINKFGELTGNNHKNMDPVSEMYYAATRYFRKIGNVPEYTSNPTAAHADGFPVISDWDDPIKYRCQANVILGIGDVFTHRDKNLPGPTSTTDEPQPKPAAVVADTAVNVVSLVEQITTLEGITVSNSNFNGNQNSPFIAGLAYDAHVRDQRGDLDGKQTVSTYWVDVREANGSVFLQPKNRNQYWLAAKYGGFRVPDGYDPATRTAALEDALWHNNGETLESGDKRPDNFYVASNPDAMIDGLKQAFGKITAELTTGSGTALAATSSSLQPGVSIFQATFRSGEWSGDLAAYPVDADTGAIGAETWRVSREFEEQEALDENWWASRKVYMFSGGGRATFNYANASSANAAAGLTQDMVDYLRGDRSNEKYEVGSLRPRGSVMGAIIGSAPLYVGPSAANRNRPKMVYVGADDGMLHAFYTEGTNAGREAFAYVPRAAISTKLKRYAQYNPNGYQHEYIVDGELTAAEVLVGGVPKTYLVGTMGRGDPGIFALDITDPDNIGVLWDKTGGAGGTDIPNLGNNQGKPVIAQIASGKWSVVLGNGPNGQSGRAALVMVGLAGTGAGVATTHLLGAGTNNALSAPVVWRSVLGGWFDRVYAGDLAGTLWRIDDIATAPAEVALYAAKDSAGVAQPISAAPLVATRPGSNGEAWVFFGTGRFLNAADVGSMQVQTWYGIKEGTAFAGRTELVQRSIIAEEEVVVTPDDPATPANDPEVRIGRAISASTTNDMVGKRGWFIDLVSPAAPGLPQGERMVVPNIFQGLALVGTTRLPQAGDPCGAGSNGFVMALDPFTGGRYANQSYFDFNNDGVINDADGIGSGQPPLPNSGISLGSGGSGLIGIGDQLYSSLDNAGQERLSTMVPSGDIERVSWREILLNMSATP